MKDELHASALRGNVARGKTPVYRSRLLSGDGAVDAARQLRLAMDAVSPSERLRCAQIGLVSAASANVRFLLLRQCYLAWVDLGKLSLAQHVAAQMTAAQVMHDVALHDLARIQFALGDLRRATQSQSAAAKAAPPSRRVIHLWHLAIFLHNSGKLDLAMRTLGAALPQARERRPFVRAHMTLLSFEMGLPVVDLQQRLRQLEASRDLHGYGRFLMGMLLWHGGHARRAHRHLRGFLRRMAWCEPMRAICLAGEMAKAQQALRSLEAPAPN